MIRHLRNAAWLLVGLLLGGGLVAASARAQGYAGPGGCYAELGEAVAVAATYYAPSGGGTNPYHGVSRMLSYVPQTGAVQVLMNGSVWPGTVLACPEVTRTLPITFNGYYSGVQSTVADPFIWYSTDPGALSFCGQTPTGGEGGDSVAAFVAAFGLSIEDASTIAGSIALLLAVAFIYRALFRFIERDSNE